MDNTPIGTSGITPTELLHGWISTTPALRNIVPPEIPDLLPYNEYLREIASTSNEINRSYQNWLENYQERMEQQINSKLQEYTWHKDDIVFWKLPKSINHGVSFQPRAAGPFVIHDLPTQHRALLYTLEGKPKAEVATDQLIYFPYSKANIDNWLEVKQETPRSDHDKESQQQEEALRAKLKSKLEHPLPEQTTVLVQVGNENRMAIATIIQINLMESGYTVHHLGGIKRQNRITWRSRYFSSTGEITYAPTKTPKITNITYDQVIMTVEIQKNLIIEAGLYRKISKLNGMLEDCVSTNKQPETIALAVERETDGAGDPKKFGLHKKYHINPNAEQKKILEERYSVEHITKCLEILHIADKEDAKVTYPHIRATEIAFLRQWIERKAAIFHIEGAAVTRLQGFRFDVVTKPDILPHFQPPFKGSSVQFEAIERHIQAEVDDGNLVNCQSAWGSPAFLVGGGKSNHKERMVVDYRAVNERTEKTSYIMPSIWDSLLSTAGHEYITVMDVVSGFKHLILTPRASRILALTSWSGVYAWTCMPFGPTNAPQSWQYVMHRLFQKYLHRGLAVFIDDFAVTKYKKATHKEVQQREPERVLQITTLQETKSPSFCAQMGYLPIVLQILLVTEMMLLLLAKVANEHQEASSLR